MMDNSTLTCFRPNEFRFRIVSRGIAIGVSLLLTSLTVWAQPPKTPAKAPDPKAETEDDEKKPPEPEDLWLETKDGWKINCTYYGPQEDIRGGKQTVPIIMIHGWGGQRDDYSRLAEGLQTYGHASIVPDLRGHGRSISRKLLNGDMETIKYDDSRKFTRLEKENMYRDIEACKKFLMEKNNNGDVNIEMLCVIGAEVGSIIAVNWAAVDWSWPQMPAFKQGQDVKALVLLSPRRTFERMNTTKALVHPAIVRQLSIMIAVGENDPKSFSEAKRIHSRLEQKRPALPRERIERLRKQDLFLVRAPTILQGTKLLHPNLPVLRNIAGFIDLRLVKKREDFLWAERRNPIGGN